jgi:hypothetical protein
LVAIRCGQQRLLQQVLGVVHRAEDAVAVHLELAPVRLDQQAERLTVSVPRQRQQIRGPLHGWLLLS